MLSPKKLVTCQKFYFVLFMLNPFIVGVIIGHAKSIQNQY